MTVEILMDDSLRAAAADLLSAAPCSVEMPAGTGKTHLLAASAAVAAAAGERSLILTHTNAGVDAIRRRLRDFGVPSSLARVDTITSWAFALVGSYSVIAEVSVTEIPDWSLSDNYLAGAARVARADAIIDVLKLSFDYLLVDEYQDCTLVLHEFVLALTAAIPRTVLFGDRLQAIFTFAGPMATWDEHVLPGFPAHQLVVEPRRWQGHNPELGQWLLDIRPQLTDGQAFDFTDHHVSGLQFVHGSAPTAINTVAHSYRDFGETVVLLDKWPDDVARHASRLGGIYSVMEDISGNFMRAQLQALPAEGDYLLAHWFARFAKECTVGLAGIDAPILTRLGRNESIAHYARPGIEPVVAALDTLRLEPTYIQLLAAARAAMQTRGPRLYRWEAWNDTCAAIAMTADIGGSAIDNLARIRDRLRRAGRARHARIASRTLLVKGLEYDHVIIAELHKMRDPRNLYVALSRARKSVTVVGVSSRIVLRDGA